MLIWTDEADEFLAHRLRQLLYRTKKAGLADGIESQSGRLRWTGESDLAEFKKLVQQKRELEAVQLYQADLLFGVEPNDSEFGAWLRLEREFLATQRREISLRLAAQISPLEALRLLEKLPLDQEIVLQGLRLSLAAGVAARGAALFARFERELLELNETPTAELRLALEQVQVGAAPVATVGLPSALTPLFGRKQELGQLADLLAQQRLITLLGIGGIGKTSLALQAARGFLGQAVFISLVGVQAGSSLAPSVVAALGLRFISNHTLEDDLFAALERRPGLLLLVLDNVEQCIEAARDFARRLSGLPNLTLLFTSRTRLGLRNEQLLEVHGLSLPITPDDLEQSGSGLAFLAAARRQRPWVLQPTERSAVLRLCHLLSGAPLALELAAAWLRALSIFEIEQEIRQSLDFLTDSLSDLPPRQASLRATFLYSWGLLSSLEQRSLRRLSVFRGGFSQEAAIQVAKISHREMLSLSEKSLIQLSGGRLSIHELIREFAAEKLREVETDWQEVAVAHAAFYVQLLQTMQPKLNSLEQIQCLALIQADIDNFRAAMTWALAGNDFTLAMELSSGLLIFWVAQGLLQEGRQWLQTSLAQQAHTPPSNLKANTWSDLAQLEHMLGDLHGSVQSSQNATAIAVQLGDTNLQAQVRAVWARVLNRLGQFESMLDFCQATMRLPCHPRTRAVSLAWLAQAQVMTNPNDLATPQQHFEEALTIFRSANSVNGIALVQSALGLIAAARQDFVAARACISEAIDWVQKIGNRFGETLHTISLARVEMMANQYSTAKNLLEYCLDLCQPLAATREISYCQILLAHTMQPLGQPQTSQGLYFSALRLAREMADQRLQLEVVAGMAKLQLAEQKFQIAAEYLGLAAQHPSSNLEIRQLCFETQLGLQQQLSPAEYETAIQHGLERGLEITVALLLNQTPLEPAKMAVH